MRETILKLWQYRRGKVAESGSKGFTLMELLIAVIISGIVTSGLLYLVVELLRIDNRETALEEVQRDTQRAMNYIADDLREAVFVYQDPATVASTVAPTVTSEDTGVGKAVPGKPILAFWKVNSITDGIPEDCDEIFSAPAVVEKLQECRALQIRRASYDLVVYSQIDGPGGAWKGSSRISRYELKQYKSGSTTLEENTGYVNPSTASNFGTWVKDTDGPLDTTFANVLVDYIKPRVTDKDVIDIDCDALIPGGASDYSPSPSNAKQGTGFFACVRGSADAATEGARLNQDVYLFLRGDSTGRSSSLSPASEASRSPMIQTQVLIRGILNKSPAN